VEWNLARREYAKRDWVSRPKENIVALANETRLAAQMEQIRAGVRVNSRVPVAVEWTEGGGKHRAEGYTVDISSNGCLAVVPQGFAVGQKLRLINLANQVGCEAVLVWRGHEGRTGWELGLALQGASSEFWAVEI
jgi:PilZ domain